MPPTAHHRSIYAGDGEARRQKRSYESALWCRLLNQVIELQQTGRRLSPGVYQVDPALWLKLKIQAEKLQPLLTRELE